MKDLWKQMIDTSPKARARVAAEMAKLADQCREAGLETEARQADAYVELLLHGSDEELAAVVMTAGHEAN